MDLIITVLPVQKLKTGFRKFSVSVESTTLFNNKPESIYNLNRIAILLPMFTFKIAIEVSGSVRVIRRGNYLAYMTYSPKNILMKILVEY